MGKTPTGGAVGRKRAEDSRFRAVSFHPAPPSDPQRAGFRLGSPDSVLAQSDAIWAFGVAAGRKSSIRHKFRRLGGAAGDALR